MSGMCVAYFSVPNYSPVYCLSTGYQPLCQSAMCLHRLGLNIGSCIPAARSGTYSTPITTPMLCTEDRGCVGSNGVQGSRFTSKCRCGYNSEGLSYCDLFPGDTAFVNYTKILKRVFSLIPAAQLPCQTTRRFQPDCLALLQNNTHTLQHNQLLLAYYNALEAPMLQNNDQCVKEIYTPYYWSLISPHTHSTEDSNEAEFISLYE